MASIHCSCGWYTLVAVVKCCQYICHTFPLFDFSVMHVVAGPYLLCALHIVFVQISITDCIHNNRCSQSDYVCDKAVRQGFIDRNGMIKISTSVDL